MLLRFKARGIQQHSTHRVEEGVVRRWYWGDKHADGDRDAGGSSRGDGALGPDIAEPIVGAEVVVVGVGGLHVGDTPVIHASWDEGFTSVKHRCAHKTSTLQQIEQVYK